MRFLPLVLAELRHARLRSALLLLSVTFAFLFYGVLAATAKSFSGEAALAGDDRLRMIHKLSVVIALPVRYFDRIAATEGVAAVTYTSWFGGIYQSPRNFFPKYAVDAATYFSVYPEYRVRPEQLAAFQRTRTAAIAGRELAERYGWSVGDRIPIEGDIYLRRDGSRMWHFDLVGIYEAGEPGVDETQLFIQHDYLEEAAAGAEGEVRWFAIRVEDPARAAEVAERLDAGFANSAFETRTTTERAFLRVFASQIADTGALFVSIVSVILFATLLVVGNGIAQSVRARLPQLAILKALGFRERTVFGLVIGESLLVCAAGAALGLAAAWAVTLRGSPVPGLQSLFYLSSLDVALGAGLAMGLAVAGGGLPALQASRVSIAGAIRRGG